MMMKDPVYVAIAGTSYYYGTEILQPGQLVHLEKEPDNDYDHEAIKVVVTPIGKVGYVANSPQSVPRGCHSAGRIYDTFEENTRGIVRFVLKEMAIVELTPHLHDVYMVYEKEVNLVGDVEN